MLKQWGLRIKQGHRTLPFPKERPSLPERFRGVPEINPVGCQAGCRQCVDACPTTAIQVDKSGPLIDLGRCLFCPDCVAACSSGSIHHTREFSMSARTREALVLEGHRLKRAEALEDKTRRIFGRSLKLRQVSAGGCNGCEAEVNALGNIVFDVGRFGIQMVASPRHADGLLITGPVTKNMRLALQKTYDAVPAPKLVIVAGACAISGGPFQGQPQVSNGATQLLPVDLYIPGCPPHPLTLMDGLLRLLGRNGKP